MECGVWGGNGSQAGSLESIILDGAKRILGCSSGTCDGAVGGDMGLDETWAWTHCGAVGMERG